jgi:hypothetical protein
LPTVGKECHCQQRLLPYAEGGYGYPNEGQSFVNVTNGKLIRLMVDDEPSAPKPWKSTTNECDAACATTAMPGCVCFLYGEEIEIGYAEPLVRPVVPLTPLLPSPKQPAGRKPASHTARL